MALYYITEPHFEQSTIYKEIMQGLNEQIRNKRIPFIELDSKKLPSLSAANESALLILGSNASWIGNMLQRFYVAFDNRIIILNSQPLSKLDTPCNLVYSNYCESMNYLFAYLCYYKKNAVAYYGASEQGIDNHCIQSFLFNGGQQANVYFYNDDLDDCFQNFYPNLNRYNAIICANDYAAVSLISHLKKICPAALEHIFIISYTDSLLTQNFSPSITSINLNYDKFGEAAVTIFQNLLKHDDYSSVHINIQWKLQIRESTQNMPFNPENDIFSYPYFTAKGLLHSDPGILEMQRIEALLQSYNENDQKLVNALMTDKTYEEIANQLFMSVNGIKYRLKAMYKICAVSNRAEFVELLKKYFQ